ncbi:acyl-CoA dehydrogenase family protein [Novosphingobium resinovorum]|uniref:Acyl-CoA dehydrogenase n=1 Tax=Novosphingobium resinovorum TaxID=158500 RepID=A0A1D8A225_9SPHN|nr:MULTISPECIES: acyl-CoA dehydrogenase family protein [Sphingomonadaceae]AOR76177.1 acyl-CoA dehydrogenase [Novosphingobium resinovorum]EJU12321.1 acyl-CoA dehydrogenase [Sphingomonas sp. LH128]MBF7011580.1 acyl-CoA dehydrogenase [Novosphingobium sp. HR1a]WJM29552.1 acyl-CoA dehydrogenase family protein [Novosphingobium resinovorum]
MHLSLNEDQRQVLDFIDSLARPYAGVPLHDAGLTLESAELDAALVENGFLDVLMVEELGPVTAALVVEKLARLPFALEAAASSFVRPLIDPDLPRPLCLVEEGRTAGPVRFLRPGASVVIVGPSGVRSFKADESVIAAAQEDALYAYPVAFLTGLPDAMTAYEVDPAEVLRSWRVGSAAEAAGLLGAALASTVTYASERKQFGRPLATFQGMRHRLAEDQVMTNSVYWLALRAAGTGDPGDAALALLHAQEAAKRVCYDYHQFLGGMGMTLEHPLHLWTYRLKLLTAELGGRGEQGLAAAEALWG